MANSFPIRTESVTGAQPFLDSVGLLPDCKNQCRIRLCACGIRFLNELHLKEKRAFREDFLVRESQPPCIECVPAIVAMPAPRLHGDAQILLEQELYKLL